MNQNKTKKTILINSAKTIFMEKGYSNTTVDEICSLAGVAKGTFFYYFETKRHIILDMIKKEIFEIKNEFCKNLCYANSTLEKLDIALDIIFCSQNCSFINFKLEVEDSMEWVQRTLFDLKIEMIMPILYDIIIEGIKTAPFMWMMLKSHAVFY